MPGQRCAIHLSGEVQEVKESVAREVIASIHRPDNLGERLELESLLAEDRMSFEEGKDSSYEIRALPDHENE